MKITYDNVVEIAKIEIPEFAAECEAEINDGLLFSDSGVHIYFNYAFVPVLIEAANRNDDELLKRLFVFMERMVNSGDKEVASVCDFSILEAVNGEISEDVLYKYMGDETRRDLDYMRKGIGYLQ